MRRVGYWPEARWSAPARRQPARSRADVVFDLVQALADAEADVQARARRPVPRLDRDVAIADQVRVMVSDLADCATTPATATSAAVTTAATTAVAAAAGWVESTLRDL